MFHWKWLAMINSPPSCYRLVERIKPYLLVLALLTGSIGLYDGLFVVPKDYLQGDVFRIIYIHVPSAFLSLFLYVMMAFYAAIGLVWRTKISYALMRSVAPIGATFTFLALLTGSIWGKPTWGTWWMWDARLSSELILFFLYLGVMALNHAIEDNKKADEASAMLAVIGVLNIPIIHYSVYWWFTLHQGQTLSLMAPKIHQTMVYPLYLMMGCFWFYSLWILATRLQIQLLQREHNANWVKNLILGETSKC